MTVNIGDAHYRHALEAAGIGIALRDFVTGKGVWSAESWAIHGMQPRADAPSIAELKSIVHPDDVARWHSELLALLADPTCFNAERSFRIVRPDGEVRHLNCKHSLTRDASGAALQLTGVFIDVTERERAEAARLEGEARFRVAVEAANLGVFERDLTTGEGVWSDRTREIYGLPKDSAPLTAEQLRARIHPDDWDGREAAFQRMLRDTSGASHSVEFRLFRGDGILVHIASSAAVLRDAAGSPQRIIGTVTDITERRRTEAALQASELRISIAVEALGQGIFDRDLTTGATQWSPTMWDITGLPPRSVAPDVAEFRRIIHPDDLARLDAEFARNASKPRLDLEFRIVRPDGSVRHLVQSSARLYSNAGVPLRAFGIVRDVTESRLVNQRLHDSEMRLNLAVTALGLGVFERDLTTGDAVWSARLWEIYGLRPAGAGPSVAAFQAAIHPEDRERVVRAIAQSIADPSVDELDLEFRIVRPDGTVRHVVHSGRRVRDSDGGSHKLCGVVQDVTERRLAEAERRVNELSLQLAVAAMDLGLFEHDLITGELKWSSRVWQIFAIPEGSTRPSAAQMFSFLHPDDRDRVVAEIRNAFSPTGPGKLELTYRIIRADGEVRHLVHSSHRMPSIAGGNPRTCGVVYDITHLRRAENDLRASELRLRLAVSSLGLGMFERDLVTGETTRSPRMWEIFGLPQGNAPRDLHGLYEYLHPDDRPRIIREVEAAIADPARETLELEFRILRPNGEVRHIVHASSRLPAVNGEGSRAVGVVYDVTHIRQAEEAASAGESRLRLAVGAAEQGYFECDLGTGAAVWSPRMWEIFGREPREFGPDVTELQAMVHPDDRHAIGDALREQRDDSTRDRLQLELRVLMPDGSERHILHSSATQRDETGLPRKVYGVVSDITERKLAERALASSEERLRLAVASSNQGVFERDLVTGGGSWSARQWEIYGLAPRAQPPTDAEIWPLVHPNDRVRIAADRQASHNNPDEYLPPVEFRILWPSGEVRHLMTTSRHVFDNDGRHVKIYGITTDITEQKRVEAALVASENRFRLAVVAAEQGVFERDLRDGSSIWSPRQWEIYGLSPRETGPSDAELTTLIHPDDLAHAAALRARALDDPGLERLTLQFRIRRPSGEIRHVFTTSLRTFDEAGKVAKVYGVTTDITDQQLAAEALAASEIRMRLALEASGLGAYERDLRTDTAVWSPRQWQIYGLEPRDTAPSQGELIAMMHPDDRGVTMHTRNAALDDPERDRSNIGFRIIRADGQVRHIVVSSLRTYDAAGHAIMDYGVTEDITEQHQAELALAASEERLRLALTSVDQGVFERDLRNERGVWSPRQWEIYGLEPRDEVPGPDELLQVIHPDDRIAMLPLRRAVAPNTRQAKIAFAFRITRPNGEVRRLSVSTLRTYDAAGQPEKDYGITTDVTERVLAQQAVADSEMRLRLAVEAAGLGVFERDMATGHAVWSPRQWEIYGFAPRPTVPDDDEMLKLLHPDDRPLAVQLSRQPQAGEEQERSTTEFRIIRPDGKIRHIVSSWVRIFDPAGRNVKRYGVTADITDERELREQAAISANLATLGQMATGIAHEFAQPLQAIAIQAGTAQILLEKSGMDPAVQRTRVALVKIEQQAERLGKTMRHLLAFGRGDSDGEALVRADEAITGALDLVGKMLASSGVTITLDLPSDLPAMHCDRLELERVVLNLFVNARDAMEGRAEQSITVTGRCEDGVVVLDIEDTGGGIPDSIIHRVFDPFFTTKKIGKGTGLGLSLSRTSLEAHGGSLSVVNTGHGARFTLRLPAA